MEQIKRELELATLPEMPKRLDYRIGIIGAGFIVRNCHLEAYRKAGFNPVAITSLDLEQSKEVERLQQELEEKEYEATAGGGVVKAVISGKKTLKSVTIDPEAVDPEDVEMLQDLVLAAVNEALRNGEKAREDTMSKLAPAGMSGLF